MTVAKRTHLRGIAAHTCGILVLVVIVTPGVLAQRAVDQMMRLDPRLAAAYHFAEFADASDTVTIELEARRAVFKTPRGQRKEWTCDGGFEPRDGKQLSTCWLGQDKALRRLEYQAEVVVLRGSSAVSLKSSSDTLQFGSGAAGLELAPAWLPVVPANSTLESIRVFASSTVFETVQLEFKPSTLCTTYYAKALGGGAVALGEMRWSGPREGVMTEVSVRSVGDICKVAARRGRTTDK
ncbi:MAG TPA: hypothetical protein DEH78_33240 [Solibacterales bacterium]|nr:hypothetical protein [Bryobacterales bacterium]